MSRKGKIVPCDNCGFEKFKPLSKLLRDKRNFCSKKCFDTFRVEKFTVACEVCGKEMSRPKSQVEDKKYIVCSRKCFFTRIKGVNLSGFFKKGNKKEKCINYKDGKQMANGYVMVLLPEYPNATRKGYVYEHRVVMEQSIGRYLDAKEVVHHINEVKTDNRIENLMLFKSVGEHTSHHLHIRHGSI